MKIHRKNCVGNIYKMSLHNMYIGTIHKNKILIACLSNIYWLFTVDLFVVSVTTTKTNTEEKINLILKKSFYLVQLYYHNPLRLFLSCKRKAITMYTIL